MFLLFKQIVILLLISYVIGQERYKSDKAIGFRSLSILMIGAYSFTYLSYRINGVADCHIIAQIITGVSFVGAGLIIKDKTIQNLTTAILIWTMAAISVLIGLNFIAEAIIISSIILAILLLKRVIKN